MFQNREQINERRDQFVLNLADSLFFNAEIVSSH